MARPGPFVVGATSTISRARFSTGGALSSAGAGIHKHRSRLRVSVQVSLLAMPPSRGEGKGHKLRGEARAPPCLRAALHRGFQAVEWVDTSGSTYYVDPATPWALWGEPEVARMRARWIAAMSPSRPLSQPSPP